MWRPKGPDKALIRTLPHQRHIEFSVSIGDCSKKRQSSAGIPGLDQPTNADCIVHLRVQDDACNAADRQFFFQIFSIAQKSAEARAVENMFQDGEIVRIVCVDGYPQPLSRVLGHDLLASITHAHHFLMSQNIREYRLFHLQNDFNYQKSSENLTLVEIPTNL